ncbi:hypothetical protein ACWKSR_11465, partial [Campylobacter fetus subsp. venerealis]
PDGRYGIVQALNEGGVNPFLLPGQTQTAAALANLERASARGTVLYGGKYTVESIDAGISGPVYHLPRADRQPGGGRLRRHPARDAERRPPD